MWDRRYGEPGWAYGSEANDFLVEVAALLPPGGRVLCLAEGQGRNALFLARLGHAVTAVDSSAVAMRQLAEQAAAAGLPIRTVTADLAEFALGEAAWEGIVSIWAHVPGPLRADLHRRVAQALAPGGLFLLEAYRPEQLAFGTGGPPVAGLLVSPEALRAELAGLSIERLDAIERDVQEGRYHSGRSAVVQLVARAPA